MSAVTKIEWCDATVNWWAGCTKVSPACDHCYAEKMAGRLWGTQWGADQPRRQFDGAAETLRALDRKAKRLGRPLMVFHNSLSDFFDNAVSVQWRYTALRMMLETPNLIHLLLTKRIGNAADMLEQSFRAVHGQREGWADNVRPNIWIGATFCNQEEVDRDMQKLLAVPAAKRFASFEPLLGPVDLVKSKAVRSMCKTCANGQSIGCILDQPGPFVDWVIAGGESGHKARPSHLDWFRSLRNQCQAAGTPFMFKQLGNWRAAAWFDGPDAESDTGDDFVDLDRVDHIFLANDGRTWDTNGGRYMYPPMPLGHWCLMVNEGKKAAGRLLDGRTWDEVPA